LKKLRPLRPLVKKPRAWTPSRRWRIGLTAFALAVTGTALVSTVVVFAQSGEYDATTGVRTSRWDRDPTRTDALLAQVTPAGKRYAITDALGNVHGFTDESGVRVYSASFDAYGARTSSVEPPPTPWGFTGRSHDPVVPGLMYYRARHYDTTTGRFLSPEPRLLRRMDGVHPYAYADANPVNKRDPTGEVVVSSQDQTFEFPPGSGKFITYEAPPEEMLGSLWTSIGMLSGIIGLPDCNLAFAEARAGSRSCRIDRTAAVHYFNRGIVFFDRATTAGSGTAPGGVKIAPTGIAGWPAGTPFPYLPPFAYPIAYTKNAVGSGMVNMADTILHELAHHTGVGNTSSADYPGAFEITRRCGLPGAAVD